MTTKITIRREVVGEQWIQGGALPNGCFGSYPEVHWSADRKLVYFTYAEFSPKHWMTVEKLPVPDDLEASVGPLEGGVMFEPKGEPAYIRKLYPFSFWSVKSESSVKSDWKPIYVNGSDREVLALLHDYAQVERWPNPIPRRIEYREYSSEYGRGFRPVYLKPGEWLIQEEIPTGHNNMGRRKSVRVMSDEEFSALRSQE